MHGSLSKVRWELSVTRCSSRSFCAKASSLQAIHTAWAATTWPISSGTPFKPVRPSANAQSSLYYLTCEARLHFLVCWPRERCWPRWASGIRRRLRRPPSRLGYADWMTWSESQFAHDEMIKDGTGMLGRILFGWYRVCIVFCSSDCLLICRALTSIAIPSSGASLLMSRAMRRWCSTCPLPTSQPHCSCPSFALVRFVISFDCVTCRWSSEFRLSLRSSHVWGAVLNSLVGVAGGATRAALTEHQARRNNMAGTPIDSGSYQTL